MTVRDDILKVVRDFPEGIGVGFVRDTLQITNGTARYWLDKLVKEGLVRKEEKFIWRKPYYWFITYYPVEFLPPPPELEYIHKTLVYNVKTGERDKTIDISITFDFDCINEDDIKKILMRLLFLKAHTWLDAKFGTRIPLPSKWAEEKERASDSEVARLLKEKDERFTMLHYKWSYYRAYGNKTEEAEDDLEDWEEEIPTGPTWLESRKGRPRTVRRG